MFTDASVPDATASGATVVASVWWWSRPTLGAGCSTFTGFRVGIFSWCGAISTSVNVSNNKSIRNTNSAIVLFSSVICSCNRLFSFFIILKTTYVCTPYCWMAQVGFWNIGNQNWGSAFRLAKVSDSATSWCVGPTSYPSIFLEAPLCPFPGVQINQVVCSHLRRPQYSSQLHAGIRKSPCSIGRTGCWAVAQLAALGADVHKEAANSIAMWALDLGSLQKQAISHRLLSGVRDYIRTADHFCRLCLSPRRVPDCNDIFIHVLRPRGQCFVSGAIRPAVFGVAGALQTFTLHGEGRVLYCSSRYSKRQFCQVWYLYLRLYLQVYNCTSVLWTRNKQKYKLSYIKMPIISENQGAPRTGIVTNIQNGNDGNECLFNGEERCRLLCSGFLGYNSIEKKAKWCTEPADEGLHNNMLYVSVVHRIVEERKRKDTIEMEG